MRYTKRIYIFYVFNLLANNKTTLFLNKCAQQLNPTSINNDSILKPK